MSVAITSERAPGSAGSISRHSRSRQSACRGGYRWTRPLIDATDELPTVISAPAQRRVLDVIPGRSKRAVQDWLQAFPAEVAANIKVVSIDPYDAYRRAIQAELPHAVIVCDRRAQSVVATLILI